MKKKDILLTFLSVSIVIAFTYSLDIPQALEVPLRK